MQEHGYISGDPWAVCDRCGVKVRFSTTRKDGDKPGLRVCKRCWDPRHPQRDVRSFVENTAVQDARPQPDAVDSTAVVTADDL